MKHGIALATLMAVGCSPTPPPAGPPITPVATVTTATPTAAPSTAPVSDAAARADALVEDLRRREAAQAQFDRENPAPPPSRLDELVRATPTSAASAPQTASPIPASATTAPAATSSAAPAAASDARGEQWWKDQARTLQVTLEEATALMNQARSAMLNSTLRITADEAEREYRSRLAAVQNSMAALDRLRDDARRAGVPAGWARWP